MKKSIRIIATTLLISLIFAFAETSADGLFTSGTDTHNGGDAASSVPGSMANGSEKPLSGGQYTTPSGSGSQAQGTADGTKRVALTFDDGPSAKYTPRLLDILAKYGAHATFFVLGSKASKEPELLARMLNEGHEIGNHSYDHKNYRKIGISAAKKQLSRTNGIIFDACGAAPVLARPPYGAKNARTLELFRQMGFACILWSVDPEDWATTDAQKVCDKVLKKVTSGSIILLHDRRKTGVDAAELILDALTRQGYTFVTVSELYGGRLQAGKVYSGSSR